MIINTENLLPLMIKKWNFLCYIQRIFFKNFFFATLLCLFITSGYFPSKIKFVNVCNFSNTGTPFDLNVKIQFATSSIRKANQLDKTKINKLKLSLNWLLIKLCVVRQWLENFSRSEQIP